MTGQTFTILAFGAALVYLIVRVWRKALERDYEPSAPPASPSREHRLSSELDRYDAHGDGE